MDKTILVVDDDPTILMIAEMILKQQYNAITANSGLECLACLAQCQVDLLLLDIVMPFMDGFQTLERIRKDPKTAGLPVIFLTGQSDLEMVRKAKGLDAKDYILKPIKQDFLLKKVAQFLEEQPAGLPHPDS